MKHFYLIFIIGALLSIAACTPKMPIYTKPSSNNKDYNVSYLFEHDGCKVYRFMDGSNCVYFTSCQGETVFVRDSLSEIRNSTRLK